MRCPRCTGSMVFEVFQDVMDDTGVINFAGYRCITCGEILDPVIAANRLSRPAPIGNKNRKLIISSKR